MRTQQRPRRYVARHWLSVLKPIFRYSATRDAFVLRWVGRSAGPVLRVDRRVANHVSYGGAERRRMRAA
jgi:hypothetical protein